MGKFTFGIICTFALYLATIRAQIVPGFVNYYCDRDITSHVWINEESLYCPEGLVCNPLANGWSDKPCVPRSKNCFNKFTCFGDNVVIANSLYRCPSGEQCNSKFEDPCKPCIPKPSNECPEADFICDKSEPTYVEVIGIGKMECMSGTVCNFENVSPCQPCV